MWFYPSLFLLFFLQWLKSMMCGYWKESPSSECPVTQPLREDVSWFWVWQTHFQPWLYQTDVSRPTYGVNPYITIHLSKCKEKGTSGLHSCPASKLRQWESSLHKGLLCDVRTLQQLTCSWGGEYTGMLKSNDCFWVPILKLLLWFPGLMIHALPQLTHECWGYLYAF